MKDSEGNIIKVGDTVVYAKTATDSTRPTLIRCKVTKLIAEDLSIRRFATVVMGKYRTTAPERILII